jgi:hydroxysqualene synthase
MRTSAADLASAYAACERVARSHYENFPVASLLVPKAMRPHVAAVYAYARAADDFADEGQWSVAERHALLDGWLHRLHDAVSTGAPGLPPRRGEPAESVEIFIALANSIRLHHLPLRLFEDLVSAFRQDIQTTRYPSWPELLDYCRRSANPVGRLVLRIAGYDDARLDTASDALCTALQLTNFWQDLEIDFRRGRIYLPTAERAAHGAIDEPIGDGRLSDAWRHALASATARTRALFAAGRPVCDGVSAPLRYELRATWLGGTRILDQLERSDFDPVRSRPKLGVADGPWLAWRVLTWPSPRTYTLPLTFDF